MGDSVQVRYHCDESVHLFYVEEIQKGKYIIGSASPIACTHKYINRIKTHVTDVNCHIEESIGEQYAQVK